MNRTAPPLRWLALASLMAGSLSCNAAKPSQPTTPLLTASTSQPAEGYYTAKMARDVYFLASDEMEGRGIGTPGLDRAADYIAARFKSLGLRELPGCEGYYQPFPMSAAASLDPSTSLKAGDTSFEMNKEFRPPGFSADGTFSAPLVFAGYGISNKDRPYDDYDGIDVKGKIVLVMRYEPHNEQGKSRFDDSDWSPDASLNTKADVAADHGAAALLLVNPPKHHEQDRLLPVSRGGSKSKIPFVHIKREVAEELLKRGGAPSLETLQTQIDTSVKPGSMPLKDVTVSGKVAIERKKVPVKNVLAYLPGERADEFVVVGAHYDHLGRGGTGSRASGSGDIHNGADDNASGTAALLDLAERIVQSGRRQRSIIFICFTGEEEGLVGSQYFVDHPPVKLENVVAMLNLDMVGRIRSNLMYIGGEGTAEAFDSILKAADAGSPLELKSIGKGGRGPSDHQTFAMKKIPVLFFFSGMHQDYHTPTDDADKVNYQGMDHAVALADHVVDALATMSRQQYVAKYDSQRQMTSVGSRGTRVTLGVVPDYGTDESTKGVRITGTTPGSPAEKAGLKEGDVILQIGEKKIENLYDLTDVLAKGKPGDEVVVTVDRGGERTDLHAKLASRGE